MAFMTIIRSFVRSPLMLIFATTMAISINGPMSIVFAVAIPILAVAVVVLFAKAHPRFRRMLTKYDKINGSVQENLVSIRTVKSFVREDHEIDKFKDSSADLRSASRSAQRVMVLNGPIMQLIMYGCMLAVYFLGAKNIKAGTLQTGELLSFMTYITQILMSLMMVSMYLISSSVILCASSG